MEWVNRMMILLNWIQTSSWLFMHAMFSLVNLALIDPCVKEIFQEA